MPAIAASTLGQLSQLQNLISLLVEGVGDPDCREQFHPDLAPLGWSLGRAAWLEAYWLRDRVQGEHGVVGPLEALYGPTPLPLARRGAELPGRDDLLVWAQAWFDDTLMRLARTSVSVPGPVGWFITQLLVGLGSRVPVVFGMGQFRLLSRALRHAKNSAPLTIGGVGRDDRGGRGIAAA